MILFFHFDVFFFHWVGLRLFKQNFDQGNRSWSYLFPNQLILVFEILLESAPISTKKYMLIPT